MELSRRCLPSVIVSFQNSIDVIFLHKCAIVAYAPIVWTGLRLRAAPVLVRVGVAVTIGISVFRFLCGGGLRR